ASEADASATETLVASGYSRAKKVSERDQCSKRRRGDLHRVTPPARTRAVERPVFEEEARRGAPRLRDQAGLRRGCQRGSGSALDDVDGEAAERCLLVLRGHIRAGLAHRLDHLVEADSMLAVAPQRHP